MYDFIEIAVKAVKDWLLSPAATNTDPGYACDAQLEQDRYAEIADLMWKQHCELRERHDGLVAEALFPASIIEVYRELSKAPTSSATPAPPPDIRSEEEIQWEEDKAAGRLDDPDYRGY